MSAEPLKNFKEATMPERAESGATLRPTAELLALVDGTVAAFMRGEAVDLHQAVSALSEAAEHIRGAAKRTVTVPPLKDDQREYIAKALHREPVDMSVVVGGPSAALSQPQPPFEQSLTDVFEQPFDGEDDPRLRAARVLTRAEAEAVLEHRGDLIAALQPLPQEGEWRPISEAPRDGTHIILAFGQDHSSEGWYLDNDNEPRPWAFIDIGDYNTAIINRSRDGEYGPTHWQPMPYREPRNRPFNPSTKEGDRS